MPRTRLVTKADASESTAGSLSFLRSRIAGVLANPLLRRGQVGLKIMSLDSGEVLFERNSESYFMPASNMKSFTVAAAIDRLGPDHRFLTSVYASEKPDVSGTINGDLTVFGRGDPSISASFHGGDGYKAIDELADKIIAAGIKKIEGDIIGDESYFNTNAIPFGWEWDDLQWYYGAEVSALSVNDNMIELRVTPDTAGTPCAVTISPGSRLIGVINRTKTVARGSKKSLKVTKNLGVNLLEISGDVPVGDAGFTGYIAVTRPAAMFADLLRQRLGLKGVQITGTAIARDRADRGGQVLNTNALSEIIKSESPPLSVIAGKIMKPSQNLYTELLLRALGEISGSVDDGTKTSEVKGIEVIHSVLRSAGIDPDSVVQYDASGLSRHNLVTPNSSLMLYKYMDSSRNAGIWKGSLTVGGVDGTLRRRFIGTAASGNVRGKTGTIDQVSALSGYVTSKSGERFVFSIITNNIPDSRLRVQTIDEIVVLLADFDGKSLLTEPDSTPVN